MLDVDCRSFLSPTLPYVRSPLTPYLPTHGWPWHARRHQRPASSSAPSRVPHSSLVLSSVNLALPFFPLHLALPTLPSPFFIFLRTSASDHTLILATGSRCRWCGIMIEDNRICRYAMVYGGASLHLLVLAATLALARVLLLRPQALPVSQNGDVGW
ncbi:hypothetical protein SCHPADRAFT_658800 [Schizopora paradoxa]|uniref:Uncharacterized protein n=1 Tax=Schizopora paradoxa TaxID=27342 RepID=A0A0H2RQV9_9AGAM|nr:hypothetical protein SCHPADRAFT_658800 [Schizopora paradoxa]